MTMRILTTVTAACLALLSHEVFAQDCYESAIVSPSPFMGNDGEVFKLLDGTLWQVKFEYSYLYAYSPSIIICPGKRKLIISGKSLGIEKVGNTKSSPPNAKQPAKVSGEIIESSIDGNFSGWSGETIFKLTNGQIWQQSSYAYNYSYKYQPKVVVVPTGSGFEMQVEGIDQRITVVRLK